MRSEKKDNIMIDLLKKSLHAGIGIALKTTDDIKGLVKELVEKGKVSEEDGKKFLDDILEKYDDVKTNLEEKIESAVKKVVEKTNLANKHEIRDLKDEIETLKSTIEELKKK